MEPGIDQFKEALERMSALVERVTALNNGVGGLRDRLDAELKLTHNWLEGVEAKLTRLEKRIEALEPNRVTPEMMREIERTIRE